MGGSIIWKSGNIANHHIAHINFNMLLTFQVSNNWPTDLIPWIFRQFLIARFFVTASGGYKGGQTGHGWKITFQKYVHPKFWGIDLNFGIFMHNDVMDNMAQCTLSIFHGFRFIALRVPSILRNRPQTRNRPSWQNEPKICRRFRRMLKFHIWGGFGVWV